MSAVSPLPTQFEEAEQFRREVEAELERVCSSSSFRTSRRSCQFLRYVVRVALDGRIDSLKERSIGMDLLCRDVSYDPSSDATVRVRANDVRKRLASFYGSAPQVGNIRIGLSPGTYVPSFISAEDAPDDAKTGQPMVVPEQIDPNQSQSNQPKGLWRKRRLGLAAICLVFCACLMGAIFVRHQREREEGYLRFWNRVLTGKKILLLSMPEEERNRLAPGLFPVVWIAGKFGVPAVLTSGSLTGATTATFAKVRVSANAPVEWTNYKKLHWRLDAGTTPTLTVRNPVSGLSFESVNHAALLTVLPESPSILYVQSTDEDALRKIFETLTMSADFPSTLVDPSGSSSLQVLLSVDSSGHSTVQSWKAAQ